MHTPLVSRVWEFRGSLCEWGLSVTARRRRCPAVCGPPATALAGPRKQDGLRVLKQHVWSSKERPQGSKRPLEHSPHSSAKSRAGGGGRVNVMLVLMSGDLRVG